ncbi:MAG: EAL domain-containing protein, partial [Thermoclostridium sp.]|nr:EAL domain-containing protein [Thermoclostridium sp.]
YLTSLPNRLSLKDYLDQVLLTDSTSQYALFFIDTDNFKYINDSLGHSTGDQLLVMIGNRLSENITINGSLFRFGGDEFIIIVKDATESELKAQAEAWLNAFKNPFELNYSILHISISIGIATYPDAGVSVDDLIRSGDIAMYHAKSRGKGQYVLFTQSMDYSIRERLSIENHLRTALEQKEFLLYYQPQIDIVTGNICGFEALLRWINPELGLVMPNSFISVAEETQLIIPIGKWVLKEACSFAKALQANSGKNYTMSVNISILQLLQTDFVDMVIDTLKETDLNPELLELEITETILMESFGLIEAAIQKLRSGGVHFALDDFGKGYSSLTCLKNLPINTLKIDKLFLNENVPDMNEESITGSIISMGLQLGLSVVAEGVELDEQLQYLAKHKCSKYQGYLFSRPVTAEAAMQMAVQSVNAPRE